MKQFKYLIIGGGMAGDAAVKGIRELDDTGSIAILSMEADPPYRRPPLTKSLWTKDKSVDEIWCGTEARGAELILERRAVSLEPGKEEVTDDRGEIYRYERLLLATGGTPRRLPIGNGRVLTYRTLGDYRRLRELAAQGEHLVVLGGSFIGSELAAGLTVNDKRVTMVFPEAAIGARILPTEFARALTGYFEKRGVTVVSGQKPSAIETSDDSLRLRLEDGNVLDAHGAVAGLGIELNLDLARQADLEIANGIVVDDLLRTKHPHVFAAGDAANFFNPGLGRRLRVEHEDNALGMGRAAGRNMAGADEPYHYLPFFYSDLFDAGYEAIGETDSSYEVVTELRDPQDKGVIFYLEAGRVRGLVFWNLFDKLDAGRELIAAPGPHTEDGLKAWMRERLAEARGD